MHSLRYTWLIACVLTVPAHGSDDAREWLERMSRALANQNYDGRFVHMSGSRTEAMRIVHRVDKGKVSERLVSLLLDGSSGREVIRNETEVICYLPDKRTVLIEKRTDNRSLLSAVPSYSKDLGEHYSLEKVGKLDRSMGRMTQTVVVRPRDQYRYGYKLVLDQKTAMPLRSQVFDRDGRLVEQIVFSELNLRERIPAAELKPSVSAENFRVLTQDQESPRLAGTTSVGWDVLRPPAGFRMSAWRLQAIAGSTTPVLHLVYSDGLASVSVFIEPLGAAVERMRGLTRVGAASVFARELEGRQVTVLGEVPAATVQAIAAGLAPEKSAAGTGQFSRGTPPGR
jgi:sigma-E factor negative regulatory protein RseB